MVAAIPQEIIFSPKKLIFYSIKGVFFVGEVYHVSYIALSLANSSVSFHSWSSPLKKTNAQFENSMVEDLLWGRISENFLVQVNISC